MAFNFTLTPAKSSKRDWLRLLPKCELHIHLQGTIEPKTLVKLSEKHDGAPLSLEMAQKLYKYDDFLGFLNAFRQVTQRLQSAEDYELITYEAIAALSDQGVCHAEMYISFGQIWRYGYLSVEAVMAAVERGRVRAEKEFGTTVFWIVDIIRQRGLEEAIVTIRKAVEMKALYPAIVGIGIGGDEAAGPAAWFREPFKIAKQAGLRVLAHAGEARPSSSIWDAFDVGAERIGHGLTAAEDPRLIEVLRERQTPLELCVSSNICTGCCKIVEEHPIRRYYDAGLMVTINSDDPPMFGTTLLKEYETVQEKFGFSDVDVITFARNSVLASFLSKERKEVLLGRIEDFCTKLEAM